MSHGHHDIDPHTREAATASRSHACLRAVRALRALSAYLNNAVLAEESSLPNEAQPLTVRSRAFEHLKFAFHDKEHLIPC